MTNRVELSSIRKTSGKPASEWWNDLTVFDKTGFASSARSPPGRVVGRDQSHTTHFRSTKISIISEIHRSKSHAEANTAQSQESCTRPMSQAFHHLLCLSQIIATVDGRALARQVDGGEHASILVKLAGKDHFRDGPRQIRLAFNTQRLPNFTAPEGRCLRAG